jgi:hypothetical protein
MLKKSIVLLVFVVSFSFIGFAPHAQAVCYDYISTYNSNTSEADSSIIAAQASGSHVTTVSSNTTAWTPVSNDPWITATKNSNQLTMYYSANTGASLRTGTVTLSTSCATATYTITQTGTDDYLDVTPLSIGQNDLAFQNEHYNIPITLISNTSWTASVSTPNTKYQSQSWTSLPGNWLKFFDSHVNNLNYDSYTINNTNVSTVYSDDITKIVYIAVKANYGCATRSTTVTFTTTGSGTPQTQQVVVTQIGRPYCGTFNVSPLSWNANYSAGTQVITVDSNMDWNATISPNSSWLTATNTSGFANSPLPYPQGHSPILSAAQNNTGSPRNGTVTFEDVNGYFSKVVTVNQDVCNDSVKVSPATSTVTQPVGSVTPQVTSNTSWSATSNDSWITVTTGVNSFTANYSANTGLFSRTGTVTLSSTCATDTYTLTQAGTLTFDVQPRTWQPNSNGDNKSFTLTSNVPWKASTTASWLGFNSSLTSKSTTGPANPNQNQQVLVYASANSCTNRTGTVTFSDSGNNVSIPITVDQNSLTTDFISILPNTQLVSKAGGSVTPVVTSNASWTAVSNQSWLTLTIGATYFIAKYDPNPSANTRTAIITLTTTCGKKATFTITQAGNVYLDVNPTTISVTTPKDKTEVLLTTNLSSWTGTIDPKDTWVTFSGGKDSITGLSGAGQKVTLYYDENILSISRTAVITFSGGGLTTTVTLKQDGVIKCLIDYFYPTSTVVNWGSPVELRWKASNCVNASISPALWQGTVNLPSGNGSTYPIQSTTTFTFNVDDGVNFDSKSITITVQFYPPSCQIDSFTSNKYFLTDPSEPLTFSWATSWNCTSAVISNDADSSTDNATPASGGSITKTLNSANPNQMVEFFLKASNSSVEAIKSFKVYVGTPPPDLKKPKYIPF